MHVIAATALRRDMPRPVRGPHVTSDVRDIAATALWICLLKRPRPFRGRTSVRYARYRRHGTPSLDLPAEEPTSDLRDIAATALWIRLLKSDIAATALWICLLKSPSPVRDHI
jgi:hypothetical protein